MPKKLSTNTKAVEARERKATEKKVSQEKAVKAAEDALWEDNDKNLAKKKKQKEEEERKKAEQLRKKLENKQLLEEEMKTISKSIQAKIPLAKITRSQVLEEQERRNKAIEALNPPPKSKVVTVVPLEENLNRVMADVSVAQTVDEALKVLQVKDDEDRHPEKRMKAAYKLFEETNMARLKEEHPTFKLSQLKQLLQKEWVKSPSNPLNQRT